MTQDQATRLANDKRSISEKLTALYQEKAEIERNVKLARAGMLAAITDMKGADGKPVYSNAEKREAALALAERNDTLHTANLARIEGIGRNIAALNIDHQYASDMLSIAVAFAGSN